MAKPVNTRKSPVSRTASDPKADLTHAARTDVTGDWDDVERHRRAADAVPLSAVRVCRVDPRLAFHNALDGRDAVLAVRAELDARQLPVDWEMISKLESLGRALVFAAGRVEADPMRSNEVLVGLHEARPLRALMLMNARAHALAGRCSRTEVERIAQGRGAVDLAQDLVDLAFLHTNDGLTAVGSAVTDAQVRRAKALGSSLLTRINPAGHDRPSRLSNAQRDARALRDRLWTVFVDTYAEVERAAGALWGRQLSQRIPALQTRSVPRKREKADAAPVSPTV